MSDSFESTDAPAPKKRAAKKAAAKKTSATKTAATRALKAVAESAAPPPAPPTPAAPKKSARKAAAPAVVATAAPVINEAPPAKKAARKIARKSAAVESSSPAPPPATAPAPAAPRTAPTPAPTPAPEPRTTPAATRTPTTDPRPPAPGDTGMTAPRPAPARPREDAVSRGNPDSSTSYSRPPRTGEDSPYQGSSEQAPRHPDSGPPHPRHAQQQHQRPPRPPHGAPNQGPSGDPRFDKNPRKRRRRGRDRWKDRQGEGPPPPHGGPPHGGGGPRQGGNPNHQRPARGDYPPRPPRGQDDRGDRGDRSESFVPTGPAEPGSGLLEISAKGFGYLRQKSRNYVPHPQDIFVTPEMVRNGGLRDGVFLEGEIRAGQRGPQMTALHKINGREPANYKNLPAFEELTAINPSKRILLETEPNRATTRIIDMIAPIGKGQRGLIVAPPRAGKTTLLQHIAEAVALKYPEMKLIILLVDERPEEVTEITRAIPQAEIYASSNDAEPKNHLRIAQIAIERAKRLVEAGDDVFIVLDSITRLARASNNAIMGGGSGRTMSGGIDARALELPRRLFASARNTREAGSLTIVGTALIETNSKADELIFQEFKGTGNMELVLDRKIAQSYVYPAVDIFKSGTRREELLLPAHQLEKINLIRRGLAGHKPVEAVERLLHFVRRHPTNAQMLLDIPKAAFVDH